MRPAKNQKGLPFDRKLDVNRLRKNARRIASKRIAEVKLNPPLKALLVALWEFCGANRFCWPSLKRLALRLGHKWPGSRGALCAKLKTLRELGLIIVEKGERPDGSRSSNKYRIIWHQLRTSNWSQPSVKSECAPVSVEMRYRLSEETTPSLPRDHPVSPERPLEPVLNLQLTTTEPPMKVTTDGKRFGGGGSRSKQEIGHTADRRVSNLNGSWTQRFNREELDDPDFRWKLWRDATAAGLLSNSEDDRLRLIAAIEQARTDKSLKNPPGWLVGIISKGAWELISKVAIQTAWKKRNSETEMPPDIYDRLRTTKSASSASTVVGGKGSE